MTPHRSWRCVLGPLRVGVKMFYMAGWRGGLAMATSSDLVNWTRPDLDIAGGNLILARGTQWSGLKLTTGGSDNPSGSISRPPIPPNV